MTDDQAPDAFRLPNGQLIDPSCLTGVVDHEAPLPTYQQYLDWLKRMQE